jgi:hypothetical protein
MRCAARRIKKSGERMAICGKTEIDRMAAAIACRPRKRSRAMAYAAGAPITTASSVVVPAMTSELMIGTQKRRSVKRA